MKEICYVVETNLTGLREKTTDSTIDKDFWLLAPCADILRDIKFKLDMSQ